jgi:hypothetical protein
MLCAIIGSSWTAAGGLAHSTNIKPSLTPNGPNLRSTSTGGKSNWAVAPGHTDLDCTHEHACLRCPMLNIIRKCCPRLDEIEHDLLARRARAVHEAWLGEVEGVDLTLTFLRQKRQETKRLARIAPVDLGVPSCR